MQSAKPLGLGIHGDVTTPAGTSVAEHSQSAAAADCSSAPTVTRSSVAIMAPGSSKSGVQPLGEPTPLSSTQTSTTHIMPPSSATMAQLSFGPATQQTVTTVTTTTTVSLPPLIMKPPKDLFDRDPKNYPLAFSPTPQSLKRFAFDINGRPATFIEAEDPEATTRRYQDLQARMEKNNGILRHEEAHPWHTQIRDESSEIRPSKTLQGVRSSHAPKRTATPPSIADAAELASLQRKSKKPRSHLHRSHSEQGELPSINQRTAAGVFGPMGDPTPITPDTEIVAPVLPPIPGASYSRRRRSLERPGQFRLHQLQDTDEEHEDDDKHVERMADEPDEECGLGTPFFERPIKKPRLLDQASGSSASLTPGASNTPTVFDGAFQVPTRRNVDHQRPNLPNILTGSQQDASLPSPSLSPITAAANLVSRNHNAFDASFTEHDENGSAMSGLELDEESRVQSSNGTSSSQPRSKGDSISQDSTGHYSDPAAVSSALAPTVMDIPTMVDAFDSMPEAMQTYLIYQFLRRCAKPTLQVVANVVNPALKCDPFNVLPPELSLNITRFLDARSMCRAAQVSKRWRRLINSDERAWKDLLDRDEFVLPKDEIARAVREGWGWQHPGEDGFEQDLSKQMLQQTPEARRSGDSLGTASDDDEDECTSPILASRSKRRNTTRAVSLRKSKRRNGLAATGSYSKIGTGSMALTPWRHLLASAQGPIAFATAAAQAVPHPTVGLPSLRNMHLFKSLYQRHYLVRKAWMQEEAASQPLHLAFRAHHRHVVTCLLFDSDKILTGSDDTKINVYDTKTGALRKRLEGHEGGVWALQYEGDTLVSGSTDRSVRVWDIKTGRCLQVFQGHTSTVRCLVILQPVQVGCDQDGTPIMMPEEPLIITGSRDSTLRVWKLPRPGDPQVFQTGPPQNDRDNPYFLRTLSGHHNSVRAIAAYGDTLISGSYDCSVRVWKISTGDLIHRLQGHTQKVYSVVLDHARNRCISGSMDTLVKVWDLQTGTCLFNLEGHTSLVGLLDLSHDRLVSAAADSTLRIWDPENGACKATLSAHTGAITCFQHDGQKVISGSDRTLKMWNVKNGECVRDLLTDLSGVWQVRFDQRRCVAAVQRNAMTYIEVLDFGAARDGIPLGQRGRRVVVDCRGREIEDVELSGPIVDPEADAASEP